MRMEGKLIHSNENPTVYRVVVELDYTINLGELQRFIQRDCQHSPIDRRDKEAKP